MFVALYFSKWSLIKTMRKYNIFITGKGNASARFIFSRCFTKMN